MPLIAGTIPDEDVEELYALADRCSAAAEREDLTEYLGVDREFHAMLLGYAGNPQLVELATALRRQTRLYGISALARTGKLVESSREHHDLVTLLRAGDGAGAERLLRTHIGHAATLWATGVEETGSSSSE